MSIFVFNLAQKSDSKFVSDSKRICNFECANINAVLSGTFYNNYFKSEFKNAQF